MATSHILCNRSLCPHGDTVASFLVPMTRRHLGCRPWRKQLLSDCALGQKLGPLCTLRSRFLYRHTIRSRRAGTEGLEPGTAWTQHSRTS